MVRACEEEVLGGNPNRGGHTGTEGDMNGHATRDAGVDLIRLVADHPHAEQSAPLAHHVHGVVH